MQAILAQPSKQAVLLFGAATAGAFGTALGQYLSSGLVQMADCPERLEEQAGLPAGVVKEELAAYAQAAAAGRDAFGKRAFPAGIDPAQVSDGQLSRRCHAELSPGMGGRKVGRQFGGEAQVLRRTGMQHRPAWCASSRALCAAQYARLPWHCSRCTGPE